MHAVNQRPNAARPPDGLDRFALAAPAHGFGNRFGVGMVTASDRPVKPHGDRAGRRPDGRHSHTSPLGTKFFMVRVLIKRLKMMLEGCARPSGRAVSASGIIKAATIPAHRCRTG